MVRTEIEKNIIQILASYLEEDGFSLIKEKYRGEHYADFLKKHNQAVFTFTVLFQKYGELSFFLTVVYPEVNTLYESEISLFKVNLKRYLHPKNTDRLFNSGQEIDFPLGKEIVNGHNLENISKLVYQKVFKKSVPAIIDSLDTLDKAERLVNNPELFSEEVKKKMLIYSSSYPSEVLAGVLLAQAVNSIKKHQTFKQYLRYSKQFKEEIGDNATIEQIEQLIEKFKIGV